MLVRSASMNVIGSFGNAEQERYIIHSISEPMIQE